MNDVTNVLSAIENGDPHAAEQLLPLVYTELRRLAAGQIKRERPGQTLNATGLVHEAYLRLVKQPEQRQFANRRHFFLAAAEAMRRILVERARRKRRRKRGGDRQKIEFTENLFAVERKDDEILAIHEVLNQFAELDPETTELVKLHFFAGLTIEDAADLLGISHRTAYRNWTYARAWLFRHLGGDAGACG